MTFELPRLPYRYDALEPFLDTQTMELHHAAHHAAYVAALNKVLAQCPTVQRMPLEDILHDIRVVPDDHRQAVRNFAGAHLNHSLFWRILGPPGGEGAPVGHLAEAISATFGDWDRFRQEFNLLAENRFASGWAWLGVDSAGQLEILTTPNQDSPIMLGYRPVLGLDLWEHAYYLRYHHRRGDYIKAWWHVVNWQEAAEIYSHAVEMLTRSRSVR